MEILCSDGFTTSDDAIIRRFILYGWNADCIGRRRKCGCLYSGQEMNYEYDALFREEVEKIL